MHWSAVPRCEADTSVSPDVIVYIPAHAKVHHLPVQTLPPALLKRLGEQPQSSSAPVTVAPSLVPTVVYISPVQANGTGVLSFHAAHRQSGGVAPVGKQQTTEVKNRPSLLSESKILTRNQLLKKITLSRLCIKTSNHAAFAYLKNLDKENVPSKPVSCSSESLASKTHSIASLKEDALVLHRGKVYLFIFQKQKLPTGECPDAASRTISQEVSSGVTAPNLVPNDSTAEVNDEHYTAKPSSDLRKITPEPNSTSSDPKKHGQIKNARVHSDVRDLLTEILGLKDDAVDFQDNCECTLNTEVPYELQIRSKRSRSETEDVKCPKRLKTDAVVQGCCSEQPGPNNAVPSSRSHSFSMSHVSTVEHHDLVQSHTPKLQERADEIITSTEMDLQDNSEFFEMHQDSSSEKVFSGLDFDETVRDEKIDRIKQSLKEKEAALEEIRRSISLLTGNE
ncbi:ligand-dependent nuclear receptor-interacting factor 1-like [Protopterus annectens]|uniref:ligand-dependent nuclear receptor-interacting factor 1-like n=1 Tax=Protopterus annectens TaxID=7888 RepID=UPI001CFBDF18|nr:ligand-dependent nuclear receptor-interacting factor 1-like [Protopterus annectens]